MIGACMNIFEKKEATGGEIYGGTGTFDNYQMCRVDSMFDDRPRPYAYSYPC
jgi:hypothetical protein